MAEIDVSQANIAGLAQALDNLDLPEAQKALLSAIVAIAADAINNQDPQVAVDVDPVPSFHDQFATAFTPDPVNAAAGGGASMRVIRVLSIGKSGD
jgi:hypothetical protein